MLPTRTSHPHRSFSIFSPAPHLVHTCAALRASAPYTVRAVVERDLPPATFLLSSPSSFTFVCRSIVFFRVPGFQEQSRTRWNKEQRERSFWPPRRPCLSNTRRLHRLVFFVGRCHSDHLSGRLIPSRVAWALLADPGILLSASSSRLRDASHPCPRFESSSRSSIDPLTHCPMQ